MSWSALRVRSGGSRSRCSLTAPFLIDQEECRSSLRVRRVPNQAACRPAACTLAGSSAARDGRTRTSHVPTRVAAPRRHGVSGPSDLARRSWSWRRLCHRRRRRVPPTLYWRGPSRPPAESWYSALLRLLNGKPAIDEPMTAVADFVAAGNSFERDFLASAARLLERDVRARRVPHRRRRQPRGERAAGYPADRRRLRVASRAASRTQSPARRRRGRASRSPAPTRRQRANSTNSVFTIAPDGEGDTGSRGRRRRSRRRTRCSSRRRATFKTGWRRRASRRRRRAAARFYAPSGATPPAADEDPPTEDEIFDYLSPLYYNSDVSAQCVVGALVYIERLFVHAGVPPLKSNWRGGADGARARRQGVGRHGLEQRRVCRRERHGVRRRRRERDGAALPAPDRVQRRDLAPAVHADLAPSSASSASAGRCSCRSNRSRWRSSTRSSGAPTRRDVSFARRKLVDDWPTQI